MLNLLVDTCVWLDIAKDPEQRSLLDVLDELVKLSEARLIVPRIVLDELARNKARVVQDSGRSMSSVFKRVKEVVSKFGNPEKMQDVLDELSDVDHKIPSLGDSVNASIGQIEELLNAASIVEISDGVKLRAAQRAIDKTAPFHRQRNGIDDAILIEVYADAVRDLSSKGQRFAFVTHNTKDFSDPIGNDKSPHPDLGSLFTKIKSRYYITLGEAVRSVRRELVSDLMLEHEGWADEPRTLSEIVEALDEFFDKIWYDRNQTLKHRVKSGKTKIVEKETFPVKDHESRPIQRDVWEGATKAEQRVEAKYGKENLGPWTDFEWGMLNGKMSALRWVLGEDWDMLDT